MKEIDITNSGYLIVPYGLGIHGVQQSSYQLFKSPSCHVICLDLQSQLKAILSVSMVFYSVLRKNVIICYKNLSLLLVCFCHIISVPKFHCYSESNMGVTIFGIILALSISVPY